MAESIRKGMLVTISVLMADMTGKTLEETPPEGIVYLHGNGDIFPKLEAALEGRFAGEGFSIHLEPEDAFGEYDAEAIKLIPAENFAHPEVLEPGAVVDEVPGEAPDGRTWRVTDIAEGKRPLRTCRLPLVEALWKRLALQPDPRRLRICRQSGFRQQRRRQLLPELAGRHGRNRPGSHASVREHPADPHSEPRFANRHLRGPRFGLFFCLRACASLMPRRA